MKPLFTLLSIFIFSYTNAQLLAFPTAEGAGKFVSGGRGSVSTAATVYEVTNLTDANTLGSFRYACTNGGTTARIIVFRISGTIHLATALTIKANTTVAGQTAPGEGICIADRPVLLGGDNIIVRYMRFRLGDKNQNLGMVNGSGDDDAFGDNGNGRKKIIIDHCTSGWSDDESLTIYKGDSLTIQWCVIAEPLNYSYHFETGDPDFEMHAFGGIWNGKHATYHHNLFAHVKGRAPRFDGIRNVGADTGDFRNNVVYDWASYNTNGGEGGTYNVVNNYYKYGPSTPNSSSSGVNIRSMLINPYKQTAPVIPYGKYYLTGNYCDNSVTVTNDNWLGAAMNSGTFADTVSAKVTVPFAAIPINMELATDAYTSVLARGGCSLPNRDTLDQRIMNDVRNRTGKLIDVQGGYPHGTPYATTVDAWPALANGTAQTDSDHDGMPDNWENARGLNPANAADRNNYSSTSGYNNLENYINGDTLTAVGTLNSCVTAKGFVSSATSQWLYARDTSYSYYLSPSYTASTDSNHIVAAILDNAGYGAFNASYYTTNTLRNDGSGHYYLNRNITLTPQNPALITQPVNVRLYISKAEFDALKAVDPLLITIADLHILRVNDNTCLTALSTTPEGLTSIASAVFGTYQNGYYVEFQTASFGTFFFASSAYPIPVKLSSFNVRKENIMTAVINWTTAQEINSRNFEVQRSADGIQWTTIATIAAAGNSNTEKSYTFYDAGNKSGIIYYRLKQNDLDGRAAFSETRKLNFDKSMTVQLYPNPVHDVLNVYVAGSEKFSISITDIAGRRISSYEVKGSSYQLHTGNLEAGVYQVKIISGTDSFNSKIIIQ
ncbi:MAG: T9SS type A sorting domain-containing protein [Ferruginibacter sp.]